MALKSLVEVFRAALLLGWTVQFSVICLISWLKDDRGLTSRS